MPQHTTPAHGSLRTAALALRVVENRTDPQAKGCPPAGKMQGCFDCRLQLFAFPDTLRTTFHPFMTPCFASRKRKKAAIPNCKE